MLWPTKHVPEFYVFGTKRPTYWVRWYDPVSKRPRSIKTKNRFYAEKFYHLLKEPHHDNQQD